MADSLKSHQQDWELLGEEDPLWAVLSDAQKRHGKWDPEEFFATGVKDIAKLRDEQLKPFGLPRNRGRALDFGCGVGRLTFALAKDYDHVTGLDISSSMLRKAEEFSRTRGVANCSFVHNTTADLKAFPDREFDLVYTNIVLQHVPDRDAILSYVSEFIRVLTDDGIAVFQIPAERNLRVRLNPRRIAYSGLRAMGFSPAWMLKAFNLSPIQMNAVSPDEVKSAVENGGGKVLRADRYDAGGAGTTGYLYFAVRG
ncbi:class I SAM-dependent methyltransferase [Candidatus Sumerlaeota bacterium]|nr:class I SAM-dependent methyltransferase [Candidatus Sumerlaeota bacterium]